MLDAVEAGVPVTGYHPCSSLDDAECGYGFPERFGIVHVDHATRERTVKDSALRYADVVARNAVPGPVTA